MCRNIKPLFNYDPPVTDKEIKDACIQFVKKISGFNKPSAINEDIFNKTVSDISLIIKEHLNSLKTTASPRNREVEAQRAYLRNLKRFGKNN